MAYQRELEKLQRRYEENPSQWFAALAEEHRRAGNVPFAIDILRRGLERRSNYVSGHIVLARCLVDQGEDAEAQQALGRVLELDAENIIALKVLGEIAERGADVAAARSWLERLLEVDPMNEEGREWLARLEEAAEPASSDIRAVEVVEVVEAGEAAETVEAERDVAVMDAVDPPVPEEPPAPLESTVQEAGITDADVDPAAEVPAKKIALVPEKPESTPEAEVEVIEDVPETADPPAAVMPIEIERASETPESIAAAEVEVVEDALEQAEDAVAAASSAEVEGPPTDESAVEITGASVEKDTPLELRPDASDGPPPEGIVGAQVDRPEPIELTGGPGMVAGSDQARELADASQEVPDSGDRSPLDTEQPPIELEDPIPIEDLEPETVEAAVPAGAEDTAAPATEESEAAPNRDPEPVLTETMAAVYVEQGLVDEALNVYRALLARSPADAELQNRIAELEAQPVPAVAASEEPRYRASETGGMSTRTFLAQVLAAGAGEEALDAAQPPNPPPSSPIPGAEGGGGEGGVSYDQFFGGGTDQALPRDMASSDEGDQPDAESDGFKGWLKGLKS